MNHSRVYSHTRFCFSMLLNIVLILSLLLGPVSLASAQDPTATPEPTLEPTVEPTIEPTVEQTIEPTVEPTVEPTLALTETPQALPNLVFAAPEGWDAPLVVSSQPGTHANDELVSGSDAYLDLAVLNDGTADIATLFTLCLKVDGEQRQCWDGTSLPMSEFYLVEDWPLPALTPGAHSFEVLVDVNNNLLEMDKLDNVLALDLTWPEPDMEELSVGLPLVGDAFPRPILPEMSEQNAGGSSAPSYWDTSAYMVGSVAIGVILPESIGGSENWTPTEIQNVKNEIQQGLQRWDDWSTASGEFSNIDPANTNVTFVYDFNESIATTYEPITMSSGQIGTWINEVMANMPEGGYNNANGYWSRVYDYLNDLRIKKGTDWAIAIFVVDSSYDYATEDPETETPGAFNDGYFGFAYLNGPLIMMTYDNAGYTIGNMDVVTQHEMGHSFGAGDNYYVANYGGCQNRTDEYGYLGIPNSNCNYDNSLPADLRNVLMNNNTIDRNHWTAQYQVGWRDSDNDSIADVEDTTPKFSLSTMTASANVTGNVFDDPYPASSFYGIGNDVTINTITSASFRIDSGSWTAISALDGSFNTDYEPVTFNIGSPSLGSHTLDVSVTNSRGNTYVTSQSFTWPPAPPSNDSITTPTVISSLATPYTMNTAGATVAAGEPANVCNAGDTGSVWYQYTVPSGQTGIYTIDVSGSAFDPNLTVLKKGTGSSTTPVVCGETDPYNYNNSYYLKLSFQGVAGSTYLVGVSTETYGNLSLTLNKETCPSGYACGVGVEGDGRVMHSPNADVKNSSGNYVGYGYGDFSGFTRLYLYGASSGTFKTITTGDYSVISSSVSFPGTYTTSAVGSPRASVTVKNPAGTQIATDMIAIVGSTFGTFLNGTGASGAKNYYLPAGTYSFFASSDATGLEVYNQGYTLTSAHATTPLTVNLDASTLARDTFTIDVDGAMTGYLYIYSPDYYGHYQTITGDRVVTFAAPVGTRIPFVNMDIHAVDSSSMNWNYSMNLQNYETPILGGTDHLYQVGGGLTVTPYVDNAPLRVDESMGYIRPGVYDAYGNYINQVGYYGWSSSGEVAAENIADRAELIEKLTTYTNEEGIRYQRPLPQNFSELETQDTWVNVDVYPTYTVTNTNGSTVYTPIYEYFGNPAYLPISPSSPTGIWSLSESVNLGPYGGGMRTGNNTFEVYSVATYALANDAIANAVVLPSLLASDYASGEVNAMSATTESTDPIIPYTNSKGYASVWYKYVAEADGLLSIDTQGSDYDTVLTVWKGSPGALTNLAWGDETFEIIDGEWYWVNNQSEVTLTVVTGQTYWIEVTQWVYGAYEDANIQSLEIDLSHKPEIQVERVGGYLHLNAELDPCYSLTLTTSTGGTVAASPATNCVIGTKKLYADGTEITVTGTKATNYGFLKWTDPVDDVTVNNPYTFTIDENTALKGNFVLLAAPGNLSPATGLLTTDNTPDFSWDAVTYGSTYEIQIDNASTFTLPLEQTNTSGDLNYTATTLTDGTHYWRVRTLNDRGEPGAWTAARSFIVDTIPPAIPTLLTPAADAWVRGTPTFTWSVPLSATGYIFEYAGNEAFTRDIVTSSPLTTPKYSPSPLALGEYWWRVKARDAAGNWSEFGPVRKVTISAPLPAAPVLTLPASGLLTNVNPLTFTWSEPAYAESFEIQFSRSSKFVPVLDSFAVDDPTWSQPLPDGLLYWRVRGLNNIDEPGAWSAARAFTLDTTAPSAPTPIAPAANSFTTSTRPTFTVSAVPTAKVYGFEVSLLDGGDFDPLWEGRSAKPTYIPTAAQELPFGLLYWRAYAEDPAGNRSAYTDPVGRPFQVSILKTPANNGFVFTTLPSFTWTPVVGATGYHIQVGTNPDVSGIVISEQRPVSSSYLATTALTLGETYYWHMCVYKGGDCSDYTPAYSFTVASAPPAAPLLTAPISGKLTNVQPLTFSWSAALNADSYELQISGSTSFSDLIRNEFLGALQINLGSFDDGLFYWRVRGLNEQGAPGAWSKTFSFTIDTSTPTVPTPVSPVGGAVVNTYTPKFTVNKITDAKFYNFEACKDNNFTDGGNCPADKLGFSVRVTTPTFVPTTAQSLPLGSAFWRASAEDAAGNISAWFMPEFFQVTNQKAPMDGAVITSATTAKPVFSWLAYPGATGYQLRVYDDIAQLNSDLVIDSGVITATSYTVPTGSELGPGKYYWYLTKYHQGGNQGTGVYTFTVSPAAPAAPLLLSPATGWNTKTSPVPLDWSEPTGAVEYDVQLSRVKIFTTLDDSDRVSTPNYDFTPAVDGLYYWRVRSVNNLGVAGAWSAVRTFVVDTDPPVAPLLSAPLDGAMVYTQTPTLTVSAVVGAVSYYVQVDDDSTFGSVDAEGPTTKNSFVVPLVNKLPFARYYWRATAVDAAGNVSTPSAAVRSFDVTILKSPVNGFYTTNSVQPFSWNAIPGASGYDIQVCTNPGDCDGTEVRYFNRPVSTTYTPNAGEAFTDGIYYWRMRVQTADGWSNWTLPFKFTKIH